MRRRAKIPDLLGGAALALLVACVASACVVGTDAVPAERATSTAASVPRIETAPASPTATPVAVRPASATPRPNPTAPPATATWTPAEATLPGTATSAADVAPSSTPIPDDGPVIVLDPGHDRTTPGALGIEYRDVLRTAFYTQAALEAAGYRVFLTRTDNEMVFVEDESLLPPNGEDFHPGYSHAWAHASKALQFEPDMVIVLHYNGHSNPDVAGVEIYYCENGGPQNLELAEILRDEIAVALGSVGYEPPSARVIEDIAVARGNRHFPSLGNMYNAPREFLGNRYAGIPVALTEPLYETNPAERALIEDEATHQALAAAYVRAVDRYFGRGD